MTDKQKKILAILACNLIFLAAVSFAWAFFLNPTIAFTEDGPLLERLSRRPAMEFVKEANGEVTPESLYLDTREVGEHHLRYTVKKWFFTKTYELGYMVEDTTPPKLTLISEKIALDFGAPYAEPEMRENVHTDEGQLFFETDLDTQISGSYFVRVTALDASGNRSETRFEVMVGDVEAPLVFRSGAGTVIKVGDDFDVTKVISYGDNVDPSPVLETTGKVNVSEVGKYPIHAVLTDASGNSTEWDFTVEVAEEIPDDQTTPSYYPFADFMEDHAGEGRHFGIDVSRWQGDIDFNAVKAAGCEFVIIRIGYAEEGVFYTDKYFAQNIAGAKSAGIPTGIYVYSYDNNEEDIRSSAAMMFEELGNVALELPVVFDWENFSRFQNYGISFQNLNHLYDVFAEEVVGRGYDSMLYGSKYYLQNVWTHTDTRPVWLAHYTSQTTYGGPYRIWQAAATGKIAGINGYVDMNIMYD